MKTLCKVCEHIHARPGLCNEVVIVDRGQYCYCKCNGKTEKLSKSVFI